MTEIELSPEEKFLDKEVQVYTTSIYTNLQIQKRVRQVQDFLIANKIQHKLIDMCYDLEARPRMLALLPDEKKDEDGFDASLILPPQIFAGEYDYCGDFDAFLDAKEIDEIYGFFRVTPPEGSAEHTRAFPPQPEEPEVEEEEEQEEVQEDEQENTEEQEISQEPKEFDPEVAMGAENIEDTQMFQAVMGEGEEQEQVEQKQVEQEQVDEPVEEEEKQEEDDGEVLELEVGDENVEQQEAAFEEENEAPQVGEMEME